MMPGPRPWSPSRLALPLERDRVYPEGRGGVPVAEDGGQGMTSMPLAMESVAKVCLRSWRRMISPRVPRQPSALASVARSRLSTSGFLNTPDSGLSRTKRRSSHPASSPSSSEIMVFLRSRRKPASLLPVGIVLVASLPLGSLGVSILNPPSALFVRACTTRISWRSRSTSRHRSAQSSPRPGADGRGAQGVEPLGHLRGPCPSQRVHRLRASSGALMIPNGLFGMSPLPDGVSEYLCHEGVVAGCGVLAEPLLVHGLLPGLDRPCGELPHGSVARLCPRQPSEGCPATRSGGLLDVMQLKITICVVIEGGR